MLSLSEREARIVAELEFKKKYYFTREDIKNNFDNKVQMKNLLHRLQKKGRIVKLSRNKYFLVPIKAMKGRWTDDPFVIADEMMNGENYYLGGWTAANYWKLSDHIPMKIEVYSTKRSGRKDLLNTRFIFRRTSPKMIKKATPIRIGEHHARMLSKEESEKWMKSRKELV